MHSWCLVPLQDLHLVTQYRFTADAFAKNVAGASAMLAPGASAGTAHSATAVVTDIASARTADGASAVEAASASAGRWLVLLPVWPRCPCRDNVWSLCR